VLVKLKGTKFAGIKQEKSRKRKALKRGTKERGRTTGLSAKESAIESQSEINEKPEKPKDMLKGRLYEERDLEGSRSPTMNRAYRI